MQKMTTLGLILSAVILGFAAADARGELAGKRPNILFIITDDQGYGDFSCHGNPVLKTPNLDRLYDQAVRFTDFHVSPTCSPTRSALMTGRHEFRNGVTHTIQERERMTLQAVTLAEVLKKAGYSTGIFGKWHLGDEAEYQPDRRGFDEVFIHGAGGIGQSFPGSCGDAPGNRYFDPAILHNGKFEKTRGYCTDVFFAQAEHWIDAARKKQQPFFAYLATNAPHAPLDVPAEYEAKYHGKVPPDAAKFFGMIANIDDDVGRLLARLKEWGLEENTLVIFMNDNGGTAGVKVFNAGMRGQKVTPWMGGTRAASFWKWPGVLRPGDCGRLAAHLDVFPTLAEIAGAKLDKVAAEQVEGRSLCSLLEKHDAPWSERTLFTHVGRWAKGAAASAKFHDCAVRTPEWRLVSERGKSDKPRWQLFDITRDPGEQRDVAAEHADVVRLLSDRYDKWWDSVQPQLVNEAAVGPAENPFKVLYRKQFPDEGAGKKK